VERYGKTDHPGREATKVTEITKVRKTKEEAMKIDKTDPKFEKTLVMVDGKWCKGAIAADDEEGWVDIIDLASMAPLNLESKDSWVEGGGEVEAIAIKTKRVYASKEVKFMRAD